MIDNRKNSAIKKALIKIYNDKAKNYGEDIRALGWNSIRSQEIRFKVLMEIGDLQKRSILDIGCGFGDLYGYLLKKRTGFKKYLGIDINPKMIAIAKRRYPEANFKVGDILENFPNVHFDYVLASGIFAFEIPNWEDHCLLVLRQMYNLCNIGVSVNFLSYFTQGEKVANANYVHPARIIHFIGSNISRKFVLRHNYKINDFTVYIYKDKFE